jgi:hypothetical protein
MPKSFSLIESLAGQKAAADIALAQKKFDLDLALASWKRRHELAEQALNSVYQARDVFNWARSRGILGGEGHSRPATEGESSKQRDRRNIYFVPIERLTREKELFGRLQVLRYAFAAHFGDEPSKAFGVLAEVHNSITNAASILIQMADYEDDDRQSVERLMPLRNALGWGTADRPDESDRKIAEAVATIETACRPVLEGKVPA